MKQKSNYLIILTVILTGILGCEKEGPIGPAGKDGLNSLIKTSEENAGLNCTNGGLKVQTGLDLDNNDILDDNEVETTEYLCVESQEPSIYSANISQSGTNVPEASIIKNELGINIDWSRTSQGKFLGTIDKSLDLNKTIILCNNIQVVCRLSKSTEIILENTCGVNAWCDDFDNLSIEIKVFE